MYPAQGFLLKVGTHTISTVRYESKLRIVVPIPSAPETPSADRQFMFQSGRSLWSGKRLQQANRTRNLLFGMNSVDIICRSQKQSNQTGNNGIFS